MLQLLPQPNLLPPEQPDGAPQFQVRLTSAGGQTFVLYGKREPATAGADLLRDALATWRACLPSR